MASSEEMSCLIRGYLALNEKQRAVLEAAKVRHELIYDHGMEATNGDWPAFEELLGEAERMLDEAVEALQEAEDA